MKTTLLLVNGSQVLMDITKKILEREGYLVRCAIGLTGAMEQISDHAPDAIILGSDLPDGKGIEYFSKRWKAVCTPVMFISDRQEDDKAALSAGAMVFLKKPYHFDDMISGINEMLSGKCTCNALYCGTPAEAAQTPEEKEEAQHSSDGAGNSKKKMNRIVRSAAACIMIILLGVYLVGAYNDKDPYAVILENKIPLGAPAAELTSISAMTVAANKTEAEVLFANPEDNDKFLTFEIILTDTGETLYASGMVEPGSCIEIIELSRALAIGEYNAVVKIGMFKPECLSEICSERVSFKLTVV